MRAHAATLAQHAGLLKIGELLRAEYSIVDTPLPESLTGLLEQLEPTRQFTSVASSKLKSTCPRCGSTMERAVHAPRLGGHPGLGGNACPKCKYIARDVIENPLTH